MNKNRRKSRDESMQAITNPAKPAMTTPYGLCTASDKKNAP